MVLDFEEAVTIGLDGVAQKIERYSAAHRPEKAEFYQAMRLMHQAVVRFIERCADAVEECNPALSQSVREIAHKPPQTFWQGLQLIWLLHLINHAFTKSLLFLAVGAVSCATGTRSMKALSGLGRKMPITTAAFIVGALAISGVPPFNIFWSKFFIIAGAIQLGSAWGWTLGLLAVAESMACFAWFLTVLHRVFFGETSPAAAKAADPPLVMLIPLLILMVLSLLSPVFGLPIITRIIGG
jgi:hypothetical protein